MNERQARALELMRAPLKQTGFNERQIYEGAGKNPDGGSGLYWLTHTSGETYQPLNKQDVRGLVDAGLITERWPGCYRLATQATPKGGE